MTAFKKAYGYITRVKDEQVQILVFRHKDIPEAGIQIPKGTVHENEDTYDAMIREIQEETGIQHFEVKELLAEDFWENVDGAMHHRYFYKVVCKKTADEWSHNPSGGGAEKGLTFQFFWISSEKDVELIRGHGDYLTKVLD
ncbi:NUDIX hydrolase [Jeotgalibacillus salarius]|uniref:NUDIX domain-containing protein n=1 Tax=Jeotgalibacillus salarius TaxID=546023 RepID=A0A4Y8LAR4_9BACL|nr:NUDIX domain-containing protein [Jeotgalibacillus salarius]TFD99467.1 NUDIX domain-containing protein [Jeotgalibacillus salarius]